MAKKFQRIMEIPDEELVTPEDVNQALSAVVDAFKKVDDQILGKIDTTERSLRESTQRVDQKVEAIDKIFSAKTANLARSINEMELKHGKDGKDADEKRIVKEVLAQIPEPIIPKDGSPDTAEDIRNKLELLDGEDRLDKKAIRGLEDYDSVLEFSKRPIAPQILSGASGIKEIRAGSGITVDNSVLGYPTISASGGGGSVETVTGLNTNNTDPANPIVQISVDGVTITGAGTPGSPLVSVSGGSGDVTGPASSTDNAIARFDGLTGKIIQDYTSGAPTISDTGAVNIPLTSGNSLVVDTDTLVVDATNNRVGIGTTSPSGKLHIYGDQNSTLNNLVENPNAGSSAYTQFRIQAASSNNALLVGIAGTGVAGTGLFGGNRAYIGNESSALGTDFYAANGNLRFFTGGIADANERMQITSGGNVGIGSTNPLTKLHLLSGTQNVLGQNSSSVATFEGTNVTSAFANVSILTNTALAADVGGTLGLGGLYRSGTADPVHYGIIRGAKENATDGNFAGYLSFATYTDGGGAPAERLRITSTGNVGIGTTAPGQRLTVSDVRGVPATTGTTQAGMFRITPTTADGGSGALDMGVTTGTPVAWLQATDRTALGTNYSLALNPNGGNVGIGTAAPDKTLVVSTGIATFKLGDLGVGNGSYGPVITTNSDGIVMPHTLWFGDSTAKFMGTGGTFTLQGDNNVLFNYWNGSAYVTGLKIDKTAGQVQALAPNGLYVTGTVGIGNTSPSALLTLGTAGTTAGTLSLAGGTSGVITLQTAAAAGTYTLTLPTTDGNASEFLQTDGSGVLTWAVPAGTGANTALSNLAAVAINTALLPGANNTIALGAAATAEWSDLFLGEGAVINWDNGDVTITQTGNVLAVAGGDLRVATADVGTNADSVPTLSSTSTFTNKIISHTVEPSVDDTFTGEQITGFNATATIAQWEAVYLSTTGWALIDADAAATAGGVFAGLAATSGTNGNPITVVLKGVVRNDGWTWTTVGAPLYLSTTAGALTETAPSGTDDVVRIVGYVLSDDCIWLNPSNDWLTKV